MDNRRPGRPATFGVPREFRELWAWGKSPVQLALPVVNDEPRQLVFPLDHWSYANFCGVGVRESSLQGRHE